MDQELLKSKRIKRLIRRKPQRGLDEVLKLYSRQIKTICKKHPRGIPRAGRRGGRIPELYIALEKYRKIRPDKGNIDKELPLRHREKNGAFASKK